MSLITQPCLTLCDPMDCSPPGSSVHGILQERILEWVAMPSSRGSFQLRDQTCITCVFCIAGRFLMHNFKRKWWVSKLIRNLYSNLKPVFTFKGLPWWLRWLSVCLQCGRQRFSLWVRKIPWRRKWQPTPVFLPEKLHGLRSLVGYSPWGCRVRQNWANSLHFALHSKQCKAGLLIIIINRC